MNIYIYINILKGLIFGKKQIEILFFDFFLTELSERYKYNI
nr:MAG TPA: hypothetical protein [Caudoviricetes sp.]